MGTSYAARADHGTKVSVNGDTTTVTRSKTGSKKGRHQQEAMTLSGTVEKSGDKMPTNKNLDFLTDSIFSNAY
jgi:hypothetical protein